MQFTVGIGEGKCFVLLFEMLMVLYGRAIENDRVLL